MTRERFIRLVEEALEQLPARFRRRIENVAVIVEDYPRGPSPDRTKGLLLGVFTGVPATQRTVWETAVPPGRIVLYQKNIEAVCANEDEIREQVRLTMLHEIGHYFGMSEDQLRDV